MSDKSDARAIHRLIVKGPTGKSEFEQPVVGTGTTGTFKRGKYVSRPPVQMSSDIERQRAAVKKARTRAPTVPSKRKSTAPRVEVRRLFGRGAQERYEQVAVAHGTGYRTVTRLIPPTGGFVKVGEGGGAKLVGILPSMEKRISSRARYELRKGMAEYGGTPKKGPTFGELYGFHVTETRPPGPTPGSRLGRTPGSDLSVIRVQLKGMAGLENKPGAVLGKQYAIQFGGNLKRSITMGIDSGTSGIIHGWVGTPVLYAKPLEFGSRHNRPYTFLRPALHQHRKKLQQYVGSQVRKAL